MYLGRVPGYIARYLMQTPGGLMHAAVAMVAASLLVSVSVPGTIPDLFRVSVWGGVILVDLWLIRFGLALNMAKPSAAPSFRRPVIWRRWLATPAIAVVTMLLLWVQAPLHVTFWLAESAMNRTARDVMQLPIGPVKEPDRWIGLYHASWIYRSKGGVEFCMQMRSFIPWPGYLELTGFDCTKNIGFAYCPDGPPANTSYLEYVHFSGPWWLRVSAGNGYGNI